MGAQGASLYAAVTYSNFVFAFAVLIWLFNLLLAVVRGTGNLVLPLAIVCGGASVTATAMPILIFGWGPGIRHNWGWARDDRLLRDRVGLPSHLPVR
jgi:Na+-driven multidrug efflux pump